ncbi:hypothetical protein QWZ10_01470 [Paracoccus cavernae]|uniref:Uncharacterized protein n=1 Tax=Paracoccus cavernae TaxID=1571207 RepID=A0ABT8D1Y1_9RHOB|nr:hypothetical protein [Paracoccus cavernae]
MAQALSHAEAEAKRLLGALEGVEKVQIVMTAPAAPRGQAAPPVMRSSGDAGAGAARRPISRSVAIRPRRPAPPK